MYNKLITRPFIKFIPEQSLKIKILESALINCYNNIPYSTFPYIFNQVNSRKSLKHFSSGNSVAMCYYIKQYLKKYKITSYLIPATLPNNLIQPKYLMIAHVAIAVPSHNNIIWILDPGLYLLEPVKIVISQIQSNYKNTKQLNIYNNTIESINYYINYNNHQEKLNQYQHIPKQTYNILFTNKDISWKYYLREIINPDKAITSFLINAQSHYNPHIIIINKLSNTIQCELIIYITANTIFIKHYNKVIYNNKRSDIPSKLLHHLSKRLNPYFNNRLLYYLDSNHIMSDSINF
tara:strand:+ start:1266 stop:2144 length:879 start_codon:yes stop_codon:yes gene_type:complete